MKNIDPLDEKHFQVLFDVGNFCSINAAVALSKLIQKKIDMKVPQVKMIPMDGIADLVGGPEKVVVCVFLRVIGDIPSNMYFIISSESAKNLLRRVMNPTSEDKDNLFNDYELSTLNEIGNILMGSYLSSLADFTRLKMQASVPTIAIDMAGAVLTYGLLEFGHIGDYALTIDTAFFEGDHEVSGHFFLVPDPDSLEKLFHVLGVPFDDY